MKQSIMTDNHVNQMTKNEDLKNPIKMVREEILKGSYGINCYVTTLSILVLALCQKVFEINQNFVIDLIYQANEIETKNVICFCNIIENHIY